VGDKQTGEMPHARCNIGDVTQCEAARRNTAVSEMTFSARTPPRRAGFVNEAAGCQSLYDLLGDIKRTTKAAGQILFSAPTHSLASVLWNRVD
jgi:hypothetical protein